MKNHGQQHSDDDYAAVQRHPEDPVLQVEESESRARVDAAIERLDAEVRPPSSRSIGQTSPHEPRFGDRLRRVIGEIECGSMSGRRAGEIADAIDRDAEDRMQAAERVVAERVARLRAQVEEAVERLRYSVTTRGGKDDVLDAEPFLERLAGIFGGER